MPGGLHNALRRSWMGDAVKKALGVHTMGEGGVERFGETLTPVMNPWGLPEWAALRGEQLCAVRLFQAAVAAEFSGIALMNPAGSNTIVVVEAISVIPTSTMTVFLEVALDTALGTFGTVTNPSSARDRRFKGLSGVSRATFRQGTDVSNTFGAQLEGQNAGSGTASATPFITALPVILRPGDDLLVIGQTVNLAFTVSWGWRERQAFPGELA